MRGMGTMRGMETVKVRMRATLAMKMGRWRIRVGIQGLKVGMQGIRVTMWETRGMRVGMRGI